MRFGLLILATLAMAQLDAKPARAQDVKAGIAAWARKDYLSAIAIWRPLAARGDPDAQFNLGQAYRLGKGVAVNLPEALSLYDKAANAGHIDAQTELGIILFRNGNQLSGLRWLRAAADGGEPRAQLLYGTALFNGDGLVSRDPENAYRYVARSAAQGLAPAKATLAEMDTVIPVEVRQRVLAQIAPPATKVASSKPVSAKPRPVAPVRAMVAAKPAALPAPVKPAPVASSGAWRIQLGAFGQRTAAEALFRKLSGGPLAGRQPYLTQVGAVTRLQAGPYPSKAAATAACATLSGRGQPCFVVAAR